MNQEAIITIWWLLMSEGRWTDDQGYMQAHWASGEMDGRHVADEQSNGGPLRRTFWEAVITSSPVFSKGRAQPLP
jgi:hypothetical protein